MKLINRVRNCPLCSSESYTIWFEKDYEYLQKYWRISEDYLKFHDFSENDKIEIVQCKDCHLLYNRTHSDWIVRDVELGNKNSPNEEQGELTPISLDKLHRKIAGVSATLKIFSEYRKIKSFKKDFKFLDYSCGGNVTTIKALHYFNINGVYGYDIVHRGENLLKDYEGTFISDIEKLKKIGKFDFITNEGALEHYTDPMKHLKIINELLKPDGLFFFNCAIINYKDLKEYKKNNLFIKSSKGHFHPWHVNHFSVPHVIKILRQAGFEILPMTFSSMTNKNIINWDNKKTVFSCLKNNLCAILKVISSWIFFRFNFFPEQLYPLYYNSHVVCKKK